MRCGTHFACADRYWGNSSPYSKLTTQNMQYLTLNNSIADLVNFARNVQLPFDKTGSSVATKAVSVAWLLPFHKLKMETALGTLRWLIQWSSYCMDRTNYAWHLLGLSCKQCTCGGHLRLCMSSIKSELTEAYGFSGNTSSQCNKACPKIAAKTFRSLSIMSTTY